MRYRVQSERGDDFEERLSLMIHLLELCNNVTHAQAVFKSWLDWKEQKSRTRQG
jgi:hypothetical protein